ncbi:MAG: hypothetical protein GC151_03590 [Betaproteobacteria bacterium]|nr:hypothetical protein [Betaproteobacteria bacterium]
MRGIRQTVRGVVYDTHEAEFVASASIPDEDDVDLDVSLFRTADDHWFLALSGDSRSRGSVTPLSREQARQWCVDNQVDAKIVRFHFEALEQHGVERPVAALLRSRAVENYPRGTG